MSIKRLLKLAVLWTGIFVADLVAAIVYNNTVYPRNIDPSLTPYLDEFIADAAKRGVTIHTYSLATLEYNPDIEYPILGQTWIPEVLKNTTWWIPSSIRVQLGKGPYSPEAFKWVVYHEFGHALLRLKHDNRDGENVMNQYIDHAPNPDEWENMLDTFFKDGQERLK